MGGGVAGSLLHNWAGPTPTEHLTELQMTQGGGASIKLAVEKFQVPDGSITHRC